MEPRRIELDLTPEECMVPAKMRGAVAHHLHQPESELGEVRMVRRTLDCRRRNVLYHCVVEVGGGERRVECGDRTPQLITHTVAQSESRESSLSMPGVAEAECRASSLAFPKCSNVDEISPSLPVKALSPAENKSNPAKNVSVPPALQALWYAHEHLGNKDNTANSTAEISTISEKRSELTQNSQLTTHKVVIVGAGPAGLFAALRCLQLGMKPVIVERGKPVEERKYDIARLAREKVVNPDSNWCFGEGGAGTYSDGKLYTRSTKRGDVSAVLRTFVDHGADPDIMLEAHAHIGTDRLSGIIAGMRRTIEAAGGEYRFNTRVTDLIVRDGRVHGVVTDAGEVTGAAVILATGHSARDIYYMFQRHGWLLEAKPFALGVRVEHPQELINEIQYHGKGYSKYLPPAAYSLTTQACGHGVFSFCMCPGGVIVPAATADGQQVVNGMSNSRRNSPFANSGIAVTVGPEDVAGDGCFGLLDFQQEVERRMFHAGGDAINAPSQRLVDFLRRKASSTLGKTGYMGDVVSAPLHELLPPFVVDSLIQGFRDFDRKMHGFITEDATLLAVESRTSSPVRIPRDKETLQHPQLQGLYPCGEGAGYAGGIVSSALDGIRCVEAIPRK